MTPNTLRDAWLAASTVSAMRAVVAAPEMAMTPASWAAFWAAYSPGTRSPRRSPVGQLAAEQAAAAEAALAAATAASAGVRAAVGRTYTRDYWLGVYGAVERERVARRQARYLTALAAPGWSPAPAWRTSDVVGLTRAMLASGDFSAVPILADALQDAGCDDEEWLAAMRDPAQPWFSGCRLLQTLL
jgi:hypothetical protein